MGAASDVAQRRLRRAGAGLTRAGSASSSSSLPIFCRLCSPHLSSLSWRSTRVKRTDMAASSGGACRGAAPVPRRWAGGASRLLSLLLGTMADPAVAARAKEAPRRA